MTAKHARLRIVPAIAVELDEGKRLRQASGEAGLENQVPGDSRPHPWRWEIYELQMKSKIAVTLLDEMFSNIRALQEIHKLEFRDEIGIDVLSHQIHQIKSAAEDLQEN